MKRWAGPVVVPLQASSTPLATADRFETKDAGMAAFGSIIAGWRYNSLETTRPIRHFSVRLSLEAG